jgi:hypothetical protein
MTKATMSRTLAVTHRMEEAWRAVDACFGRFCLTAGIETLQAMMAADVEDLCGKRHARGPERRGQKPGLPEPHACTKVRTSPRSCCRATFCYWAQLPTYDVGSPRSLSALS